jgi:acyl-CoA reductase-like NAD-dependent aldehyde dehydrogenase
VARGCSRDGGAALGEVKDELYALSVHAGCTRADAQIDVDGGIGVLFTYASKGRRELPNASVYLDGDVELLAKDGSFVGWHLAVPMEGAAVHINAFNFPVWGMLEKLAPAILAGVPVVTKPASPTAYVAEAAFRQIVAGLPEGRWHVVGDLPGGTRQAFTGWGDWASWVLVVVEPTAHSLLSARRLARMANLALRGGTEGGVRRVPLLGGPHLTEGLTTSACRGPLPS